MAISPEGTRERLKQLPKVTQGFIWLGNKITSGKATAAGAEFREKHPNVADTIYKTPLGQTFSGTVDQNARARTETLAKYGEGSWVRDKPITAEEAKQITVTEPLENLNLITKMLPTGLKKPFKTIQTFSIGLGIGMIVIIIVILYFVLKRKTGVQVNV